MKTTDRSLEIVAVGLGQAGGNLAAEFNRRGYRGLAFNTAHTDLSSLGAGRYTLPDSQRIYIGLEGYDGAGSDADYGRECVHQHADLIRRAVKEHAVGADVVVLAAGLGGGTGSSVSELITLLDELDLPTVVMTTLPHHHESGIAKVNALCAVRDLASTPTYGWALLDNARLARFHHEVSIDSYFDTINSAIVEPLDVFNRLNERESAQAIRTLDGEDFRTLLLSGGVLNYHSQVLPSLSAEGVLQAVRGALSENTMMPAGFDISNVAYMGLVIEASEQALHESPFSLYEEIAEQLKKETGGAAIYLGLYRQLGSDDSAAAVRLICSSNALPSSIGNMLADAEREANRIQHKVQQSVQALDLGGLEDLHLTRRPMRSGSRSSGRPAPVQQRATHTLPEPTSDESPSPELPPVAQAVDSVAEQAIEREAEVPEIAIEPQPEPELELTEVAVPPLAEVAPEEAVETKVDELRRLVAVGEPTETAVPEEETVEAGADSADVYRARFERLATAYRNAPQGDSKRIYIGRELVAAQRSTEALERFYAAHAMARLDASYFKETLKAAAQDADSHVADLAKRALKSLE